MKIFTKLLIFLMLFIFFNILCAVQFYYFRVNNLFTLNLFFLIFLIIFNRYLGSKAHFSDLSIKVIVAISTVLIVDLIASYINKEDINLVGKNLILKEFVDTDFHSGAGYRLRDGLYHLNVRVIKDNSLVSSYQSDYTIKNSQRVVSNISSPECVDILMIGGSHNFGQALPDKHTLQFELNSQGYSTANISTPGYGLVNNFAILEELKDRDGKFWKCPPKYIIYRFIKDHINRDNAKSMFSPNGVHISEGGPPYKLKRNYADLLSAISYFFTKYIPTRILTYGSEKESELSFRLISQQLQRLWFFTENDIKRSAYLLGTLDELWEEPQKKPVIVVIIDSVMVDDVTEKYTSYLKKFKNIKILSPSEPRLYLEWSKNHCSDLPSIRRYIPYEGHPTGCFNRFLSQRIANLLTLKY